MKNIVRMIAAGLLVAGGFSALSAQERGIDRPVPADILSVDDYRRAERRLKAGVEAGKISKEDAEKRLIEMRKRVEAGKRGGRPEGRGRPEGGENAQEKGISVEDYRRAEKRMKAGIEAGKISKEDAEKRLIEMRKAIHSEGEDGEKEGRDERGVKFRAIEEEIWAAVKAGKLSKEAAHKKLAGLKKEIWGGDLKKDSGDKKKGSGYKKDPDIEVLKRQLEALKRENEGLRKRLEKGKGR